MKKSAFDDFSEYAQAAMDFASSEEYLDFKTCRRSDGSYYGVPDKSSCAQKGAKEVRGSAADNILGQQTVQAGTAATKPVKTAEALRRAGWDEAIIPLAVERMALSRRNQALVNVMANAPTTPQQDLVLAQAAKKNYERILSINRQEAAVASGKQLRVIKKQGRALEEYYNQTVLGNLANAQKRAGQQAPRQSAPQQSRGSQSSARSQAAAWQGISDALGGMGLAPVEGATVAKHPLTPARIVEAQSPGTGARGYMLYGPQGQKMGMYQTKMEACSRIAGMNGCPR